ncbi:MAG: hypothetical protein MUO76_15750 [Anaerolineaceae bacterium]|nr:hypothetical protein [Anaerolineaceae bacterium]
MIGDINGATSMAPMITAAESVINPKVAMVQDKMIKRKKSKLGEDASASIPNTVSFRSKSSF